MSNVTFLPLAQQRTDKTDRTEQISNEEFLSAIFSALPTDVRPVLVTFGGDPGSVKKSNWSGFAWSQGDPGLVDSFNNYFSLSAFKPNDQGEYKRKKAQFAGCYCIMLDDVGVKVPKDALTLPPSWLLETSPGNYQAGYILADPILDPARADALMKAVIAAGLCDPGASGPTARLARLPVAVNGKHSPEFCCRLEDWQPQFWFTEEELIAGLGLEVGLPVTAQKVPSSRSSEFVDDVWQARPVTNPVVAAMQAAGLYKTPLGEDRHDISCPWVNEHTGAVDGGTAYFEPSEDWPLGGFSCLHGHCRHRRVSDLIEFLKVDAQAARMRPVIKVIEGDLHRVVDAAERALSDCGYYYQRGGCIVTVNTQPETMRTQIKNLTPNSLTRALGRAADWKKYDARQKGWVRKDPPARHINVLHDSSQYKYLPALTGLSLQPYLRQDESVVLEPGYDAATKVFGVFDSRQYSIALLPTQTDALESLSLLNGLLEEFEFAAPVDRAAALSAMLTAAVRPSLPLAPMFHVKAHMPGSGKSYLCQLISAFATPQKGTTASFPDDDTECHKLLVAELINAPAVIEFDNITTDLLAHKSLCSVLTSGLVTGRILGSSQTVTVSTRTLFLSSGNNVGPIDDMSRRCLTINLSPVSEMPAQRTFLNPRLIEDVLAHREIYVSAALTIVSAWIHAGKPMTPCKQIASYGPWSEWCRQSLLWLCCADPVENLFNGIANDPERELLGRLLNVWHAQFGSKGMSIRGLMSHIQGVAVSADELREVLDDIAGERGEVNRRRLGHWLKRHAARRVDGKFLIAASSNRQAVQWAVRTS